VRQQRAGWFVAIAGLVACAGGVVCAQDDSIDIHSDTQLRAMADELARSKTLKLNDLDRPYFIQYAVSDIYQVYVAASLGGLLDSSRMHVRQPSAQVRVGDYHFDNTNSIYSRRSRVALFPVDDDYPAMRAELWIDTDTLYKASADQIARKRAATREMADPDQTPDFAPAKRLRLMRAVAPFELDQRAWEQRIRALSARMEKHPDVIASGVALRVISSTYRLINSEGTVLRVPQSMAQVEIHATALAPDGSRVSSHQSVARVESSQLPSSGELASAVDSVGGEASALAKAPVAEEYSGPVLFEQEAAAQMMAQVLTDAIRLERRPVAPVGSNDSSDQVVESVWSSRVGSKVAPDWLSIEDDPRETQLDGAPLAGHFEVDDEGVPAQPVTIVEGGTLKTFLTSREPVKNLNASNGHGRLPGAFGAEQAVIGNLFVRAAQSMPEAKMKPMLIEKAKTAGLKYGLLIRRIDFPSNATFEELQTMARQLQKHGYSRTLNAPLLAYRVYPDGREELVRGLRFREFSARELRDLEAASDRRYVLNYLNNGSSFNLAGASTDATTSSVICPSLLINNVDLEHADEDTRRLPVVPPPALASQ
jgi:PmbA/TldA metallopeptidase C-terminal domain